jgi:hypothetical protein
MPRNLKKQLLYPIIIYIIISIEIAAIVASGLESDTTWVWIATTSLLTILLIIFAKYAKPASPKEGAKLGLIWAATFLLLDILIVAIPFTGISYFQDIRTWIPYLLGLLIPLLAGKLHTKQE